MLYTCVCVITRSKYIYATYRRFFILSRKKSPVDIVTGKKIVTLESKFLREISYLKIRVLVIKAISNDSVRQGSRY